MKDDRRPMILLLDDEKEARETMRELFEDNGCSVVSVASMQAAIGALQTGNFDIVVTDINLQGVDSDRSGMVFANVVKLTHPQLPVAAYSGNISAADIDPEQYRTFDAYLNKARSDPSKTNTFVQNCILLARTRRQVVLLAGTSHPPDQAHSTQTTAEMLDALREEISQRYIRKPTTKEVVGFIVALVGLIGAIASIVAVLFPR